MKLLPPTQEERNRLSRLCFFLVFGFFTLSFVITFYPGAEFQYGSFTACLFIFVFLISRGNSYRVLAGWFLLLFLLFALFGYWRGIQYRTWLAENSINFIAVVNETQHSLQHIELRSDVKNVGPGELAKGEHGLLGFMTKPVPAQAQVTWDQDS